MSSPIESLFDGQAGAVWRHFADLASIPRPSKYEGPVRDHLAQRARANGWEHRQDAAGNVVFAVSGRGSLADAPALVLQGHLDMVCEKNRDTAHDFMTDPIRLQLAGDWVTADGTTLGADNGVAVALAMAVAEADMPNRMPLELLFTIDEETGLNGALDLDPKIVHGKQLLNLDSEEDGVFTIGCAGGIDMNVCFAGDSAAASREVVEISLRGLRGGHSGVNIHEGRANAIRILARIICELRSDNAGVRLHQFVGGNKKNAIPREASAIISGWNAESAERVAERVLGTIRDREPAIEISFVRDNRNVTELPISLIDFLVAVPHGVMQMDAHFPDLVHTSNSIGVLHAVGADVLVGMHGRSFADSAKDALSETCQSLALDAGATFSSKGHYPGWEPTPDSDLRRRAVAVFAEVFGHAPRVEGIHAGLETGILGKKLGISELLSTGPTIENAHSPDERLLIESLNRNYAFLAAFVST
ncbi:MAG: dipeptidase D [Rhodothermales bacterium]|jgi:dipeptidase D